MSEIRPRCIAIGTGLRKIKRISITQISFPYLESKSRIKVQFLFRIGKFNSRDFN